MRVLIADKVEDFVRARLEQGGFEVVWEPTVHGDTLREALSLHDPQVVLVRSTKVQVEHFTAGESLELVVRAGAGVNTIDLVSASEHGVRVCNCPGMNAAAVAELTLGLILSLDRNIPDNVADLRAGVWNKARYAKATGLRGRTLGVVGLGNIGAQVAALGQAFGMDVICWTYPPEDDTPERMGIPRYDTPEEVAANCDVLTAHLALNDATRGFISRAVLEALPDGAFVINTSRAKIVDEEALLELLDSKGLRAGLDLFSGEPAAKTGTIDDPLAKHPNVYGTHHIGASTAQAQLAVGEEACRVIEVFEAEGVAVNCVNPAE